MTDRYNPNGYPNDPNGHPEGVSPYNRSSPVKWCSRLCFRLGMKFGVLVRRLVGGGRHDHLLFGA